MLHLLVLEKPEPCHVFRETRESVYMDDILNLTLEKIEQQRTSQKLEL